KKKLFGILFGDRGYISASLFDMLFQDVTLYMLSSVFLHRKNGVSTRIANTPVLEGQVRPYLRVEYART
ncbi:MAG: transposase, partial [Tannerella sp.]|nr:transposase [Tannerella sp.]